jgi:ribosome recycling factor
MNIKELESKLQPIVGHLKEELSTIRTNRPSPKLVEGIKVTYLEQIMTVQQLGSITITPPRQIVVTCWDRSAVEPVASAINKSGLGVSALADGNIVRVNLPSLTDERRAELEKLVKSITETSRIGIRTARDEFNKKIEAEFKSKSITEDQKFKLKEEVQKTTDRFNKEIEELLSKKVTEIHE